jgi:hypothetical protein
MKAGDEERAGERGINHQYTNMNSRNTKHGIRLLPSIFLFQTPFSSPTHVANPLAKNFPIPFDTHMAAGQLTKTAPHQYVRQRTPGQLPPTRPALTSDLRKAVTTRVSDTGPPPVGQGAPFIRTRKPRLGNAGRNSKTFKFFFL